jgi:hypothetical protein
MSLEVREEIICIKQEVESIYGDTVMSNINIGVVTIKTPNCELNHLLDLRTKVFRKHDLRSEYQCVAQFRGERYLFTLKEYFYCVCVYK